MSTTTEKKPHKNDTSKTDKDKSKKRAFRSDTDFLCIPQYQNSLPHVPSGPYFTTIKFTNFEKYANFKVSTLEKSYVWKPHFGPDVGLKLDLVDQEVLLIPQSKEPVNPDPEEMKYLKENISLDTRKNKKLENYEKPWWLRSTTYLENNLFNNVKDNTKDEKTRKRIKLNESNLNLDPYSIDYIENSFIKVDETEKKLIQEKKMKFLRQQKLKSNNATANMSNSTVNVSAEVVLEYSIPILPYDEYISSPFSLLRFDENYEKLVQEKNEKDAGHRKVKSSIVTNVRVNSASNNINISDGGYLVSMVSNKKDEVEVDEGVKKYHYDWVADFKMDIKAGSKDDFALLVKLPQNKLNGHAAMTSDGLNHDKSTVRSSEEIKESTERKTNYRKWAKYCMLGSRVDMKKLLIGDSDIHESDVIRVKPNHYSAYSAVSDSQNLHDVEYKDEESPEDFMDDE